MNKLLFGVVLMLMLSVSYVNAQSHDLKYKLNKGKNYRFYQETVMNITQSFGFLEQEIKNKFTGITRFTPIGTEGNNIVLEASFETMTIKIESIMLNVDYDSSKPSNPEDKIASIYNGIVGKNFKMVITPQGKIKRIEGINELINKGVNSLKNTQTKDSQRIKKTIMSQLGEDALVGNMEMILAIYPQERKKIGDKWSTSTQLSSELKADINNNWTFADASNRQWKLLGKGSVTAKDIEATMNGMRVTFDLSGTQESEYKLNQIDGWFVSCKNTKQMVGKVFMKPTNQLPQGMEIPMSVKSVTRIEKR